VRGLSFASRWFDPATVDRTFEPLVADWQREWYESASSRRPWVSVRAWAAFMCSAAISSPGIIATPTPRSMSIRVARRIALFCLFAGGGLCIPMTRVVNGLELGAPLWAGVMLVALPAALAIAFPFAMVIAVDAIRQVTGVPPHVERAAAVKLGLVAMLAMITVGGWLAPLAGQQWLEVSTPAGWNIPSPSVQQLSTLALLTHPERNTAIVSRRQYTRAGEIRRELLQRAMMSAMPAIFVWLRWSTLSQRNRRRFWPLPGWAMTAAVIAVYFATFFSAVILEAEWGLLPGTGFVLPVAVFSVWAAIQQGVASRMGRGPVPLEA
jgi:hypothetical protein